MTTPILMDTCALIWIAGGEDIADPAREALDAAWRAGFTPSVSPISAWEVGLLVSRGRLALTLSPERWWAQALERMRLLLAPMPPALLIASTQLPGAPPTDPADRIIAATAREQGLRLMTRDGKLLTYGEAGHLSTVAC